MLERASFRFLAWQALLFPDFLAISKIIELLPNQPRYYEGICAGTCYQPVIPDGMACYITRIIMSLGGIGVFRSSRTCMECTCSHLHDIFLLVNGYKSILVVIRPPPPPPPKEKKKGGVGRGAGLKEPPNCVPSSPSWVWKGQRELIWFIRETLRSFVHS